jgi:hypothetical protein
VSLRGGFLLIGRIGTSRILTGRAILAGAGLAAALPICAQYVGQVTKNVKDAPELRAVAVLEWTGEAGKPKTSRIVPVAVLDQGQLQDGGIYLARPEPLAIAGEVEYELDQNGKAIGLFDIENTGREQGSWVGYGKWKPMPEAKPAEAEKPKIEDEESDEPVLHRKKHPEDAAGGGDGAKAGTDSGASSTSSGSVPDDDPDRPKLHKKSSTDDAGNGSGGSGTGSSSASAPPEDPDRPVLKKEKKKQPEPEDLSGVSSVEGVTDPDRPRLKRGKSNADSLQVTPSLMGLPPDMQQAVAVSDTRTRPEHPWTYTWADSADEAKMKAQLEDVARNALGIKPPPPPTQKKTAALKTARKTAKPMPPPPEPIPLDNEQFRVFELAYGSGATLVLSAHTDGPLAQQKFVTLIAQPDLYGNLLVLLKNMTDGASLDDTPRMRLVDAVDALADNRGELLFELRGNTQRQFALYRVLRGRAEKLFVNGGEAYGAANSE